MMPSERPVLAVGDALDASDRVRHRREIGLAAHAAQQKLERAVAGDSGAIDRRRRSQPLAKRRVEAASIGQTLGRIARNRTQHHGTQRVVEVLGMVVYVRVVPWLVPAARPVPAA